ncbi:thiol reductant ABC exporter subunit CydD [Orrella marina]|uniref:Thiol reductant ABC exporter subunit CydD n=1 Tax=Orrella marina TaxID=2163011 RepID=A0A2R4XJY9_9BURK|nr:thiol reductant ABC exporter subunit CydD [Orrella marina]AWB34106.1 thiol reductant ABC exporter subunit CydD [Orrella marina]
MTTLKRAKPRRSRQAVTIEDGKAGSLLHIVGPSIWIGQAACLALVAGGLAEETLSHTDAILLISGFLALSVVRSVLENGIILRTIRQAARSVTAARINAVREIGQLSPFDRNRPAAGGFASTVTEQAGNILPYRARFLPARTKSLWVPIAILIAITPISWVAALILLLSAPMIPLFMVLVGLKARSISQAQLVELYDMNAYMLDRLRGMQTIRSLGAVEATSATVLERARNLQRRIMAVLKVAFLSSAVLELFSALGVALVAVYVGFHLLGDLPFGAWGQKMSLTQALFVLLLSPAFYEPLRELAAAWHDRASGQAAIAQLESLCRSPLHGVGEFSRKEDQEIDRDSANVEQTTHELQQLSVAPSVELRDVTLSYRHPNSPAHTQITSHPGAGSHVFDGLNLKVMPGEHIAIMAPSGGGKSTLLGLIAGLIKPDSGEIKIGTVSMSDANAHSLRTKMAWIGQKPHIFKGSATRNITLGRRLSPEELDHAVAHADLQSFTLDRSRADLAEGGAGMSGGELVRLSIARALADQHASLLLVDEPTAHLDAGTARNVSEHLFNAAHGKTMIVVTHDPMLCARADRTVRLRAHAITEIRLRNNHHRIRLEEEASPC